MAARATQCPHCRTSFRVTEAQLATARGLVRCGACLEVFNATEHWLETSRPSQQPSDDEEVLFDDDNGLPDGEAFNEQHRNPDATLPDDSDEDDDRDHTAAQPEAESADTTDATDEGAISPAIDTESESEIQAQDSASAITNNSQLPVAEDDAVEQLGYQRTRLRPITRQQLGWSLLSLLAALGLAGQLVYANFAQLAQSNYRPQLSALCEAVNVVGREHCKLPPPQNLALIRSQGLNIYSHPTFANSLLVDALIINQAVFEQPFPVIELEFHDHNGRAVARRRFTPAEYLAGELRGAEFMPSQQAVHINIGILDPGATAVNYEMRFHPADSES